METERADEIRKVEEEEEVRKQAALIARDAARLNPAETVFKDFANFPEEYVGKCLKFERVWFHGGLQRHAEKGLFTAIVSSDDGKLVMTYFLSGGPGVAFVTSEPFGRVLDIIFKADQKIRSNIWCEVMKENSKVLAKIYRIETIRIEGTIFDVYDDPTFNPSAIVE